MHNGMPKEDTQFKVGNPGGPGRPKGSKSISDSLKRILESKHAVVKITLANGQEKVWDLKSETKLADAIAMAQVIEAMKGKTNAFNAISDRIEGKPQSNLKLEGDAAMPIKFSFEEKPVDG